MKFPLAIFRVSGHSMEPTFKAGDLVLVNRWAKPKVGDIIVAFDTERNIKVIKRIQKVNGSNIVLTGDNPGHGEKRIIDKSRIIGKVVNF